MSPPSCGRGPCEARSEGEEKVSEALAEIATLPRTADLGGEEIILQIALLNTLMHVKGYGAPETKAAVAQVRALIEQAERLGESPDDLSLLLSALFGPVVVNFQIFNGDLARKLATPVCALCGRRGAAGASRFGTRQSGST